MYALRYHDALGPEPKAAPNTIWRMEDISTPELSKESGYVTPNVNVVYGFGFLDLRREPILLEAPDSENRYYMVEILDMWTNAFAYVGGKATGYKGGKFLLAGPYWKGDVPEDLERIDCPTPWVLLQPRVHIYKNGKLDLSGARKVLSAIRTVRLSEYLGKPMMGQVRYDYPAPQPVDPNLPVSVLNYQDPLQFWELLSLAMNENPPPKDQAAALLPLFKPLGLELGKKWDRRKVHATVLGAMTKAAQKIGAILADLPIGTEFRGANIPPPTIGNFGTDYLTRAVIGRVGLTANTPAESVYWMVTRDQNGSLLSGTRKYTLTFKEGIPYEKPGFWSITLYDATNNYTVPNSINRYMIGSDSANLKKNEDGSFTIYIQQQSPGKNLESNWLPAPAGAFYLTPRAYPPKPETIRILKDPRSWPIPVIVPVP
jgi:DNA sulfur modification protein DndE